MTKTTATSYWNLHEAVNFDIASACRRFHPSAKIGTEPWQRKKTGSWSVYVLVIFALVILDSVYCDVLMCTVRVIAMS